MKISKEQYEMLKVKYIYRKSKDGRAFLFEILDQLKVQKKMQHLVYNYIYLNSTKNWTWAMNRSWEAIYERATSKELKAAQNIILVLIKMEGK